MASDAATALRDTEHHLDLATQFVAGLAVTRCLEIISEASRRLPDEMKARYPAIARKNMAGPGNVYRHNCEDVAAKLVWDTVQLALPPLRKVVAGAVGGANEWPISVSRWGRGGSGDPPQA
jgi:uncharacterized protein with HEPN domain